MIFGVKWKILLICLAMVSISVCVFAGDAELKVNYEKTVWFDSNGNYHYGDILSYLNAVHDGSIDDPQIKVAINPVVKPGNKVKKKHVVKIARRLDPLKFTAAIYLADSKLLKKQKEIVQAHFAKASDNPGDLNVHYFGVQFQGNALILEGTAPTNIMVAVPADPVVMASATIEMKDNEVPPVETLLITAASSKEWSQLARSLQPQTTGKIELINLHPGPWIIYQNQYNFMTHCYRVQIGAGRTTKLIAEKNLWRSRLSTPDKK